MFQKEYICSFNKLKRDYKIGDIIEIDGRKCKVLKIRPGSIIANPSITFEVVEHMEAEKIEENFSDIVDFLDNIKGYLYDIGKESYEDGFEEWKVAIEEASSQLSVRKDLEKEVERLRTENESLHKLIEHLRCVRRYSKYGEQK